MTADSTRGIALARTVSMARRVTALFGMVAIAGLLAVLIWRVYLHHEHGVSTDEPAVVSVSSRAA